jgi:hypothetical protein
MTRTAVSSSTLKSVGYVPAARTLDIEFHSGSVRRYYEVPQSVYTNLMAADSLGRYYNTAIKGQYDSRPIPEMAPASPKAIEAMQLALQALEDQDYAPYTLDDEDHPYYGTAKALLEALREAGIEPDPVEQTIDRIIRNFDWDRVLVTMRVLDWKWHIGSETRLPTLEDLQGMARKLLREVASDPEHRPNGSGGLLVQVDEERQLELLFVVTGYAEDLLCGGPAMAELTFIQETTYVLEYHEVDDLMQDDLGLKHYAVIADEAWGNNESHVVDISPEAYTPADREVVAAVLRGQRDTRFRLRALLSELADRGIIPWGKYRIDVLL